MGSGSGRFARSARRTISSVGEVIDLHSHILPGLDDGVATIEEARELARAALAEGVTAIAATPHVREDYPTTPEQMEAGVAALRADFAREAIDLELLHGGEIDLEALGGLSVDDVRRFTLAQSGRYLLVEFPYYGWPLSLEATVFELGLEGIVPILAHPERTAEVQSAPERLRPLVDAGALVQITAAAFDGRLGRGSQRTATELLRLGLAHVLASDAHGSRVRRVGLAAARDSLGDAELARYLTQTAPRAIAAGEPLPPRPAPARRARRLFRHGA
jgi:protein-tyrosine phosphatase